MEVEKMLSELIFKAVRSSGAGGQNVNKVSSKVVLSFDLKKSNALSDEEKELVLLKLNSRLTTEGILILNCDEDRSQLKNKAIRKTTKIPKSVIRKRIKDKKNLSEIKKTRRRPEF
jgi:ribosome-associated protein